MNDFTGATGTTFTTTTGKSHDLKLNFLLARKLSKWDFTSVSPTKFTLMQPAGCDFGALYTDYGLLAAIAFAVILEKEKLADPTKTWTESMQATAETMFLQDLDGATLDHMRNAVWGMLKDFFPSSASDFTRIEKTVEIAMRAAEKNELRMEQVIQEAAESRLELAKAGMIGT